LTNSAWRILADFYIRSGGLEKNHLATLAPASKHLIQQLQKTNRFVRPTNITNMLPIKKVTIVFATLLVCAMVLIKIQIPVKKLIDATRFTPGPAQPLISPQFFADAPGKENIPFNGTMWVSMAVCYSSNTG
jgi:hypothetical protein